MDLLAVSGTLLVLRSTGAITIAPQDPKMKAANPKTIRTLANEGGRAEARFAHIPSSILTTSYF
jgi:hypothetical protein